jgi:ABC-type polysaccharide/polyol phosphate export permease
VYFRDVQHIVANLLTLWFFLCPIIYPFTIIPEKYKFLIYLNPMALFSMAYQNIYYFNRYPELPSFITLLSVSFTIFFIGSTLFSRLKPVFAEEL